MEHHRAITTLVEAGHLGSAAALIRPLLETAASVFWLVYSATDNEILAFRTAHADETSKEDIPTLGAMATALKDHFQAISTLTDGLARKGNRTAIWLHKYTHGGTPQLVRRDRVNGWLEGEVVLALLRADVFVVLGASVRTVLSEERNFHQYIFEQRDVLASELMYRFGVAVPSGQSRVHPAPDKQCCGPALFAVG
ncbi:MAG: DUF6988 family protein [Rhodanobacteraceae bacterium]